MKKVNHLLINKIWGYEKWLYSCVSGKETNIEGVKTNKGPLIKIIKANSPLSVQVHPDDILAKKLESKNIGKSESWYIIESKKDSTLVVGLKDYNENNILSMIKNKIFEKNLIKIKVKPGDFINVPAGMVHGIGANLKVLEVQQPSDITYRYYDYNRLENGKPRELHIKKALLSQKEISYKLDPKNKNSKIYINSVCSQEFLREKRILKKDSIIIDIDNEIAYEAKKGEKISLNNYCIISYIKR